MRAEACRDALRLGMWCPRGENMGMVQELHGRRVFGLICALPAELGSWAGRGEPMSADGGFELRGVPVGEDLLITCVGGVGKVAAARAAEALLRAGVSDGLLVVGTCGSLSKDLPVGALVHCSEAIQADLGVKAGRRSSPDSTLMTAWERVAPGFRGIYLTSDRAVFSPWRRFWVRRGQAGACVAEMETAAIAACAVAWGVPWVALRAVTDSAGRGALKAFKKRYPVEAGRAADTVEELLSHFGA